MVWAILLGLIGTGLARVAGAPRSLVVGLWLGVGILIAMLLIADPSARPTPGSVTVWGRRLLIFAGLLLPVLGYAFLIRALRNRARGADTVAVEPRETFVLIQEDGALAGSIRNRIAKETGRDMTPPETFSIAYRNAERAVTAAGRITLSAGCAEFRDLWVDPASRRQGLGARLLGEMESEARDKNANLIRVEWCDLASLGFWTRHGYVGFGELTGPDGTTRHFLYKDLG